ncbi:MAG: hypothetical protein E7077_15455 [Bacteroidales bacterium]|jgi:hypothetical protein|nr:hypothetical protein [Bacteroidales bacterium]
MKKIFNVIGICALMCYLFLFPSCEKTYDGEELLRDIEKKRNEREMKVRTFVYAGDTFHLPARIKQIDSTKFIGSPGEPSYKYSFNASDKEAIMQSLFKHTSELSEYGNFELSQEQNFMRTTPPLSEVKIEVSDDATHWYFVDTNSSKICSISFYLDSENPYFIIEDRFDLDMEGNVNIKHMVVTPQIVTLND